MHERKTNTTNRTKIIDLETNNEKQILDATVTRAMKKLRVNFGVERNIVVTMTAAAATGARTDDDFCRSDAFGSNRKQQRDFFFAFSSGEKSIDKRWK